MISKCFVSESKMNICDNCDPILEKVLQDLHILKERLFSHGIIGLAGAIL